MAHSRPIQVMVLVIFLAATVDCAGTSESKAIPRKRTFLKTLNNLVSFVDRNFRRVDSDIEKLYEHFDDLASSVDALERRCKPVATTPHPDATTTRRVTTPHPVVATTKTEGVANPVLKTCGDRWTNYNTSFFSFCTCTQRCSANDAMKTCEEKHAELAKCNSSELENFFVLSLKTPIYILLGGNDLDDEGTWRWPDGSLMNENYTNWYPGQPNGGKGQNCLEWYARDAKWYDGSCDYQYSAYDAGFVCEKKLQ